MGEIHHPEPALLLLGAISRFDDALRWSRDKAVSTWGPCALESTLFQFDETTYYESTMGPELQKTFFTFEQIVGQQDLADWKRLTDEWEAEYTALAAHEVQRPLNLDPGYITQGKLVLASTKDHSHRIFLRRRC